MKTNQEFEKYIEKTGESGYIIHCSDPIVYLSGLPSLKMGEAIVSEDGERGMVYGLDRRKAGVLMFETEKIEAARKMARTDDFLRIPVSEGLLGRIVDPLCLPIDRKGPVLGAKEYLPIKEKAPGITKRVKVAEPLETGVMMVDLLVPLGYGQRETVIGDAKTGKTNFLLQTISNQAKKGTICVYVGIGKESPTLKSVESYLKEMKAFDKVVMMVTTSSQSAALHYLAPFSGTAVAEYFRNKGHKVIIVYDDFSTHAKAYREISLLLKRAPGREAYPGDIFYVHATLIERAGNIKTADGKEASITSFPIVETLENNISGFIQTNLLAMTDGHVFFDIDEFKRGQMPAVNAFLSVSRVGNQTRESLSKDLVDKIKKRLVSYRKILEVAQFGSELSKENKQALDFGGKIEVLLSQDAKVLIPRYLQLFLFGLLFSGFWKNVSKKAMKEEVLKILRLFQEEKLTDSKKEIKEIKDFLEVEVLKMKNAEELKDFCEQVSPVLEKFI